MPCMWLKVTALTFGEIEEQSNLNSDEKFEIRVRPSVWATNQKITPVSLAVANLSNYQECLTGCLLVCYLVERSTDVSTHYWQNGHNFSYICFSFICGLKHNTTKVVFGPLFVVTLKSWEVFLFLSFLLAFCDLQQASDYFFHNFIS